MAESVQLTKRRGRPKKIVEEQVDPEKIILVVDENLKASAYTQPVKSRKTTVKKPAETIEDEVKPKKRASRKATAKDGAMVETKRVTRTRRSAKSADEVTMQSENIVDIPVQAQVSPLTSSTASEQTPSEDVQKNSTIVIEAEITDGQFPPVNTARTSNQPAELITKSSNKSGNEKTIQEAQISLENLTNDISYTRRQALELCLLFRTTAINRTQTLLHEIRSAQEKRALFATRVQNLHSQISNIESSLHSSADHIQSLQLERIRSDKLNKATVQLTNLQNSIQQSSEEIQQIISSRAAAESLHERSRILQALDSQAHALTDEIQQSAIQVEQLKSARIADAVARDRQEVWQSIHTQTALSDATLHKHRMAMQKIALARHASSSATTSSQSHLGTKQTSQVPSNPHSPTQSTIQSKIPQPSSSPSTPPTAQPQPRTNVYTNTPQAALPQRPTSIPYDSLRQTPQFKQQQRIWLSRMIGIPVLITASYLLYKRYQDTLVKRQLEGVGENGVEAAAKGYGVGRRSNAGVNGGV